MAQVSLNPETPKRPDSGVPGPRNPAAPYGCGESGSVGGQWRCANPDCETLTRRGWLCAAHRAEAGL
jgi:hypothetical protein